MSVSGKVRITSPLGLATITPNTFLLPASSKTVFQRQFPFNTGYFHTPPGHSAKMTKNPNSIHTCVFTTGLNFQHRDQTVSSQELGPVKVPVISRPLWQRENRAGNKRAAAPPGNSEHPCMKIGIRMAACSVSNNTTYYKAAVIIPRLREVYLKVHVCPGWGACLRYTSYNEISPLWTTAF